MFPFHIIRNPQFSNQKVLIIQLGKLFYSETGKNKNKTFTISNEKPVKLKIIRNNDGKLTVM